MLSESGHVNWIEFLWVLEGFAGIFLSLYSFNSAWVDREIILEANMNHGLRTIARTNIQMEIFRIIPHCFVVAIGLIAWTLVPSPYPQNDIGWAITIMLFGIPLCAATNTINSIITRHKLMKINGKG